MDYRSFPLFRSVPDQEIAAFVGGCSEARFAGGEVFIHEGEAGARLYFVLQGELEVFLQGANGGEQELALITAPAVVGEMEFLTGTPGAASVRARTPARALVLAYDRLRAQLEAGDAATLQVFFHIAQVIARRLAAMNRKFAELEQRGPGNRFHELRDFQHRLMSEWTV